MKAALAQFIFESNTFAPGLAEIDLFKKRESFSQTKPKCALGPPGPTRRCTVARGAGRGAGKPPPVSPPSAALPPDG